jgi:hypothetical protein
MIDIEIMGWRGWFLWTLTFLGISSEKLAIGTALMNSQKFNFVRLIHIFLGSDTSGMGMAIILRMHAS